MRYAIPMNISHLSVIMNITQRNTQHNLNFCFYSDTFFCVALTKFLYILFWHFMRHMIENRIKTRSKVPEESL